MMKWKLLKYNLFPGIKSKTYNRDSTCSKFYKENKKTFFRKTSVMLKKDYYSSYFSLFRNTWVK